MPCFEKCEGKLTQLENIIGDSCFSAFGSCFRLVGRVKHARGRVLRMQHSSLSSLGNIS